MYHAPVLLAESITALAVKPDGTYLDGTVGGGGHLRAIVGTLGPHGTAIGIDRDPDAVEYTRAHIGETSARVVVAQARFSSFDTVLAQNGIDALDGALLDLGVSSHQLDTAERGFSYQREAPLDLRMDRGHGAPAAELVKAMDMDALARTLAEFGEVRNAGRMARTLHACASRNELLTTLDLRRCLDAEYGDLPPKVLSKVFQALRIAVNDELDELHSFLSKIIGALRIGGRLAIIAYHSLEDRMVKRFIRDHDGRCVCPPEIPVCRCGRRAELKRVSSSAIRPSDTEIDGNRRARSARLRIAERV